jgi:hypothetical protein
VKKGTKKNGKPGKPKDNTSIFESAAFWIVFLIIVVGGVAAARFLQQKRAAGFSSVDDMRLHAENSDVR